MKKINSIGFLILLVTLSCQRIAETNESNQNEFVDNQAASISDTLSTSKIHQLSDNLVIVNSFEIVNVNDTYLVISEQRSEDFINVFELPSVDHLYSFGRVSQGPEVDEFTAVPVFIDTHQDQLVIHDAMSRGIRYVDIDRKNAHKSGEKSLSYEGQMDPLNQVRRIDENLYFADYGLSNEQTDREFVALEPGNSDTLFTFGKYPESEFGKYPSDLAEGFDRYNQFMKENLSNPDGTRFAAFYLRHNKFKIFNQSGEELNAVSISDNTLEDDLPDGFIFRTAGWASNDYVYSLGLNGTWAELIDNPEPDENRKTTIEVWDWNGESIYRAHFDRMITKFTVSEEHGRIFGLSATSQDLIFEYNLPDF